MNKKIDKKSLIIVILLILILVLIGLLLGREGLPDAFWGDEDSVVENIEKNPNSISMPGFEIITLKAEEKHQTIAFENPAQNCCYFKISLLLEDGTLLWESNYIEPGENSKNVKLKQRLEKGTYRNAVLKYSCFALQDKRPLDGAEMKLTINVVE